MVIGNVAFYGASAGEAYIQGMAGERFCVRNSGVQAVVEGVGDHGCEYMTGGRVVILGPVGKNFAAGMSGGVAYVLANDFDAFADRCNRELVWLEGIRDLEEAESVRELVHRHVVHTGSSQGQRVLSNWESSVRHLVKVIPRDYKQMLDLIERLIQSGMEREEAIATAFEQKTKGDAAPPSRQPVLT